MSLKNFFISNKKLLSVGLLLAFFSGFGQTYLISLYVPSISKAFQLTNSAFGSLYAAATILSAATLVYVGKWIDRISLRSYSLRVFIFFAISLLITAYAIHPFMLFIGLWGLRLGGQGLMSHTSITAMSRYFDDTRGKAISVASLGYPFAEGIFPIIIAISISTIGWQYSLTASAAALLIVMVPVAIFLLPKEIAPRTQYYTEQEAKSDWRQRDVLKSKHFSILAPGFFLMPFASTGLFFYQLSLAEFKGWTAEWIALCFVGFAIASSSSMIASGYFTDRYKAKNLFPFFYLPFLIGLICLLLFTSKWTVLVYMTLMGVSVGFGKVVKSALQAELFGVKSLGAVRSLFSTLMVFSTALGPALFGLLLDKGFDFNQIIFGLIITTILVIALSFRILTKFTRKRMYLRLNRK